MDKVSRNRFGFSFPSMGGCGVSTASVDHSCDRHDAVLCRAGIQASEV